MSKGYHAEPICIRISHFFTAVVGMSISLLYFKGDVIVLEKGI